YRLGQFATRWRYHIGLVGERVFERGELPCSVWVGRVNSPNLQRRHLRFLNGAIATTIRFNRRHFTVKRRRKHSLRCLPEVSNYTGFARRMQGTDYPHVTRPGSNECGRSGCRGSTRTVKPYWPLAAHGTKAPNSAAWLPDTGPTALNTDDRGDAISPSES